MLFQEYFTHYPSRLSWVGGGIICLLALVSGFLLIPVIDQPAFPLPSRKIMRTASSQAIAPLQMNQNDRKQLWELPSIQDELLVSLCPPRPGFDALRPMAHLRLKSAQQSRRVSLPNRMYLFFNDQGVLCFQDSPGPFWVDLSLEGQDNLIAKVMVVIDQDEVQHAFFSRRADLPPLQKAEEFPVGSFLRTLADARWLGVDVVCERLSGETKQRLEIGSSMVNVSESEWLAWVDGKWSKISKPPTDRELPIARIRNISGQTLEWDVWDASHTRLAVALQPAPPNHFKTEEWMNSLRIRSEKQVSCVIEKQSFILRQGDWVIKENGRWRTLRKPDAQQQAIEGSRLGDLFLLEKIDNKQKTIKGKFFFANRIQTVAIEAAATNAKHDKKSSASHSRRSHKEKNL